MEARSAQTRISRRVRERWALVLGFTIVCAAVLRVWLVMRGGQYFWADEGRFHAAEIAWKRLVSGDLPGFAGKLF